MDNNNKIWIPSEIKQKEILWFKIPFLGIPITSRDIIYFLVSIPFAIIIFILCYNPIDIGNLEQEKNVLELELEKDSGNKKIEKNIEEIDYKIANSTTRNKFNVVMNTIYSIITMFFIVLLGKRKKEGKYIEERLSTRVKHSKNAGVLFSNRVKERK